MWTYLKRFLPTKQQIIEKLIQIVRWADRRVPPGLRTILGILSLIGGILSFLPVLGIWMLPAGAMLIALDVPPWRRRLLAWIDRQEAAQAAAASAAVSGAATSEAPNDERSNPADPSKRPATD
jgi:hypothetical protein